MDGSINQFPEQVCISLNEQNLIIKTPWIEINEEFRTECALLDALIMS